MQASHPGHLPQLTWLRGIAALFVLFSHINRANETSYTGEQLQDYWLLNWLDLGSFGVVLFFTLSGCTLYLSSYRQGFPDIRIGYVFYVKRFFRIWPAFAVSLLVYIIVGHLLHETLLPYHGGWLATQFTNPYSFTDILNYMLLVFNFTGPSELFNNAYWSLPVEFQYYLTLPLLIILLQRYGPVALFAMVVLGHVLYKADISSIDSPLVFRLFFTFCFGIFAGYLYANTRIRLAAWFTLPLILLLTAFTYLFSAGVFNHIPMPSEWILYGLSAVGVVILSVITTIRLPKKIDDFLTFYGDISYSLYLFHNLIIAIVVVFFIQNNLLISQYKLLYLTISTTIFSTFVAWFSYKYIELPMMHYGKHLSRKYIKSIDEKISN
ncbi:acyltransferase family protein [Rheinheimera sp. UJ63]|uniref:acyltransferase family protein n=1 Tax=Rheinheimera sp. UJ63 TaxID=2910157 RepID=UPI001F1AA26E|nr:acyltransferase [Rheinheimera sp. UJ63]MCF4007794.1 acyltransferase [Rheinheimera sp. UJ63]